MKNFTLGGQYLCGINLCRTYIYEKFQVVHKVFSYPVFSITPMYKLKQGISVCSGSGSLWVNLDPNECYFKPLG